MILFEEEQLKKNLHPDLFDLIKPQLKPIELPSDEEIKDKSFNKFTQSNARTCFEEGAKWVREKILNQNK